MPCYPDTYLCLIVTWGREGVVWRQSFPLRVNGLIACRQQNKLTAILIFGFTKDGCGWRITCCFSCKLDILLVALVILQNATIRFVLPVVRLYVRPQATPRVPLAKFYIVGFLNPVEKKSRLKPDRNERHFSGTFTTALVAWVTMVAVENESIVICLNFSYDLHFAWLTL